MIDPYEECPEFETAHFKLRQVREADAADLLCFYGDLNGWMFFGKMDDVFPSRFATQEQMKKCITCWLGAYSAKVYVRFSLLDKATGKAVGTLEMFDKVGQDNHQTLEAVKQGAALHLDLSAPYEKRETIEELLMLAEKSLSEVFGVKYLLVRAVPSAAERIAALRFIGYQPFEWETGREHFYMKNVLS